MSTAMMKALQLTKTEGMKTIELPKPLPAKNELLVKVKFSVIDTSLDAISTADLNSNFIHNMRSSAPLVVGYHFSGVVQAVGEDVKEFHEDDAVFGHLQYTAQQTQGTLSEYVTIEPNGCAKKPASISWETAAACATETMTALQAMRDRGGLAEGKSVLIMGAGGGIGGIAIGIAKSMGASSITGVCSTHDVERVKELGADVVVNRKKQDLNEALGTYDVIFDAPSSYRVWQVTKWLNKGGSFVNTHPANMDVALLGPVWGLMAGKTFTVVLVKSKTEDLELVASWIDKGTLKVPIDSIFDISKFNEAWEYRKNSKTNGRIVIKVEDSW